MASNIEQKVRDDFPHLNSLAYVLFPDHFKEEEQKYKAALASEIARTNMPKTYISSNEEDTFGDRVKHWIDRKGSKNVLNALLFVTLIFFLCVGGIILLVALI